MFNYTLKNDECVSSSNYQKHKINLKLKRTITETGNHPKLKDTFTKITREDIQRQPVTLKSERIRSVAVKTRLHNFVMRSG